MQNSSPVAMKIRSHAIPGFFIGNQYEFWKHAALNARKNLEHYRQSVKGQRDQNQRRHEQQVQ